MEKTLENFLAREDQNKSSWKDFHAVKRSLGLIPNPAGRRTRGGHNESKTSQNNWF